MLREIERKARASMTGACAAGAVAMALLAPLAARPSGWTTVPGLRSESPTVVNSPGSPWTEKPVVISRDPFLAPAAELRLAPDGNSARQVARSQAVQRRSVGPPLAVRAIAVGENSRALVDVGGVTRLVGVGDSIGSLRVISIRIDRIQLSDGSTALLDSGHP